MDEHLFDALLCTLSLATGCGLLSLFVVARRWAFVGEGIGHAGFGGAGTAWIIAVLVPALDLPWLPYAGVFVFSVATAIAIGWLSRRGQVSGDVAVGIFLVAAVAWGFLGQQIYLSVRQAMPIGFDVFLFGQFTDISRQYALATLCTALGVALVVWLLNKELLAYCIDPITAETSGVRVGLVHYLLIALLAVVIVVGVRVVGTLLVTALLILPAASATQLSRRHGMVVTLSLGFSWLAALGGTLINRRFTAAPTGPMIVLILFATFIVSFAFGRWTGRRPAVDG